MELLKIDLKVNEKIVQESLTRIGISNRKKKILYPSCYLVKLEGEFYLAHFKEMFLLKDGGYNNVSDDDIKRRNAVAFCLKNWGLIDVEETSITPHDTFVFVLPYGEKESWKISHKINTFTYEGHQ